MSKLRRQYKEYKQKYEEENEDKALNFKEWLYNEWAFIYDEMYENFLDEGEWEEEDYHPVFFCQNDEGDDYFCIHMEEIFERYGISDMNDFNYKKVYDEKEYWVERYLRA